MLVINQLSWGAQHLSAPLYFHFGHYDWFIDVATSFSEIVDTNALYFLFFIFLNFAIFYKNTFLKNLFKGVFKVSLAYSFNFLVMFYHSFFFSNLKKMFSYFSKFFSYFSKKK